ncbi:MAG: 4Fe-4S dicluster domain-containing protein [Phycisphaerae bacterium]|jgi:electron transport complex protein RnfC|nr:4Fe-4S dicluster domain-containing protein [Phycisphaerae bacterium]
MRGPKIRRFGTFSGGIDLPDDKGSTLNAPIGVWDREKRLSLPLGRNEGAPVSPVVEEGQKVTAGELIAAAGNETPDIFAPAGGIVTGLSTVEVAGRYSMRMSQAIDLKITSTIELPKDDPIKPNWRNLDEAALWDRITEGQIMVHCRGAIPLARWVLQARSKSCDLLVANAMEQQPLVTTNHRLLVEFGREVVEGLAILARATGINNAALVVPRRRTDAYRDLAAPAAEYNITQVALSHKYPTEADTILTKVLTRRSVPPGRTPMDVQVAVIDPATCFAVYRWTACAQRLAGRIVTVSGSTRHKDGNYFLPFGTRCLDVIDSDDPIVIHGGPLVGMLCNDTTVVTPATDAVLSITPSPYTPSSQCIRCGWCTDHCPARLNVAALNDDFELSLVEHARRSDVSACVGCGVCSYICPARLPLMQRVRQLKLAAIHATTAGDKRSQ